MLQVDDGGVADRAEAAPIGLPENHLRVKNTDQQLAIGVEREVLHRGGAEAVEQWTEGLAAVVGAEGPGERAEVDGATRVDIDFPTREGPEEAWIVRGRQECEAQAAIGGDAQQAVAGVDARGVGRVERERTESVGHAAHRDIGRSAIGRTESPGDVEARVYRV